MSLISESAYNYETGKYEFNTGCNDDYDYEYNLYLYELGSIHLTESKLKNLVKMENITIDQSGNIKEYLLATGAKLYPPNSDNVLPWRISGYSREDIKKYLSL